MARQIWFQYFDYEKGCTVLDSDEVGLHDNGEFYRANITTSKQAAVEEIALGKDVIVVMIGVSPKSVRNEFELLKDLRVRDFLQDSIDLNQQGNRKIYFLEGKFVPLKKVSLKKEHFDEGWQYAVWGHPQPFQPPILLRSEEFRQFWNSYKRHGLLCLSNMGCPFPELEQIGEGLRPSRPPAFSKQAGTKFRSHAVTKNSTHSNFEQQILIPECVIQGIAFLRQIGFSNQQWSNFNVVCRRLREVGRQEATVWIEQHPKDYIAWSCNGFQSKK